MTETTNFSQKKFPPNRLFTMDVGKIGRDKHHIKAMLEFDVTDSRSKIKKIRSQRGEKISFTAWLLKCIAQAISEHKEVHALRKGRRGLLVFDDVDISLIVEKELDGEFVPLPTVIRAVNKKTLAEIFQEIEEVKNRDLKSDKNLVLERKKRKEPARLFALFPQWLRLIIWRIILADPLRRKKMMGTCLLSFVGMMGQIRGWFIPYSIHNLAFAIGSVVKKPACFKNEIVPREFLEITILIDHDVIDGAPAARFTAQLKRYLEKGFGLD